MKHDHTLFVRTFVIFFILCVINLTNVHAAGVNISSRLCLGCNNNPNEVRGMQQTLKDLGYYKGSVSGHMGALTEKALKEFQFDHEISVTGQTGDRTRAALADPLGTFINRVTSNNAASAGSVNNVSSASNNTNNIGTITDEACNRSITCSTLGKDVYLATFFFF